MNSYGAHVAAAADELTRAYTAAEADSWRLPVGDLLTVAHARSLLWASLDTGLHLTTGIPADLAASQQPQTSDALMLLLRAVAEARPSGGVLGIADVTDRQSGDASLSPFAQYFDAAANHLAVAVDIASSHLGPQSQPRTPAGAELLRRGGAPDAAADVCSLIEVAHFLDRRLQGRLGRTSRRSTLYDAATTRLIQDVSNDVTRSARRTMPALAEAAAEQLRTRDGHQLRDVRVAVPPRQLIDVHSPGDCATALDRIHFHLSEHPANITIRQASAVIKAMLTLTEAGERLHLHAARHADDPSPHQFAAERWRAATRAWRGAYTPLLDLRTAHQERGPVTGQALLTADWVTAQTRPPAPLPLLIAHSADAPGRQWAAALPAIAEHGQRIADDLARSLTATRCVGLLLAPNRHIERGRYARRLWAPLPAGRRLDELVDRFDAASAATKAASSDERLTASGVDPANRRHRASVTLSARATVDDSQEQCGTTKRVVAGAAAGHVRRSGPSCNA